MKVKDLINILKRIDPEKIVRVDSNIGYQGHDIYTVSEYAQIVVIKTEGD